MSSFIKKLINPETGKTVDAFCIDNYYGGHRYGYGFRKDGKDAKFGDNFKDCKFYKEIKI